MAGDADVRVESSPTRIVLTPRAAPRAALVFLPGGKFDPRAYVPLLRRVSAAGYLVVVREPYDIGFLAIGEPARVVAATPGVTRWAVSGHSLGGVAAGVAVSSPNTGLSGLPVGVPVGPLRPRRRLRLGYGRRAHHTGRRRREPGAAADVHRLFGRRRWHPRLLRRLRVPARRRLTWSGPGDRPAADRGGDNGLHERGGRRSGRVIRRTPPQ
jgi:hypothetical protein